ncbi:hypothetical protein F0P96_14515 [Hymenobacter busanensis]|uniref:Uncharacterized protein n=1 Tax=Hymenobacter busanensis TaxID=2607656 RepID=A0A7L4ZZD0_9BACT|nr:hypothetical protein [Hymenobacter busanensis]KAA9331454.1 hypothetical protein F0P96_14515 [Hymenobacter busanensis]QHJ08608.1 hypothetical protein GUY19_15445 [Hymenobacter busanensis]
MVVSSIDPWLLSFDPQLLLLCQRWHGRYNMQLFRTATQQVIQAARDLGVRRLLFDLDGLPNLSFDDQVWFSAAVMPTLPSLQLSHLAVVFGANVYNQLAAESIVEADARHIQCDMQFFADAQAAHDWLTTPGALRQGPAAQQWLLAG